jgi:hypothetical protein
MMLPVGEDDQDPYTRLGIELERIEEERQAAMREGMGQGLLARYPMVDTDDRETKVRMELSQRGMSDEQIDKKVAKFKKKGGKVKLSAKLGLAANALGRGLGGYLAVSQRRPMPKGSVFTDLEQKRQLRLGEIEKVAEGRAQQQATIATMRTKDEVETASLNLRRDIKDHDRADSLIGKLGLNDQILPGMSLADKQEVISVENRRIRDHMESTQQRGLDLREQGEERLGRSGRVNTAFKVGSAAALSNEDIATILDVDPNDSGAILAARNGLNQFITEQNEMKMALAEARGLAADKNLLVLSKYEQDAKDREQVPFVEAEFAIKQTVKNLATFAGNPAMAKLFEDTPGMKTQMLLGAAMPSLKNANFEQRQAIIQMLETAVIDPTINIDKKEQEAFVALLQQKLGEAGMAADPEAGVAPVPIDPIFLPAE